MPHGHVAQAALGRAKGAEGVNFFVMQTNLVPADFTLVMPDYSACNTSGRLPRATNPPEAFFVPNPAVDSLFSCAGRSRPGERKVQSDHTARAYDPDSQLQNNLNRWYDASVGRWLNEDSIGFAGGDGNLYRYASNGVLERRDPIGLEADYLVFVDGESFGTWRQYSYPTGSFDIKVRYVKVNDPVEQSRLGQQTIGYQVTYNASKGVCSCRNETVHLVQALYFQGLYAGEAHFDAKGDTTGYPFPPYPGQGNPGQTKDAPSFNDAPNTAESWLSFGGHWVIEVCAVCTTVLNSPKSPTTVVLQQVLGCVSFAWYQAEPPAKNPWLEINGQRLSLEGVTKTSVTVPATPVGSTWSAAAERYRR